MSDEQLNFRICDGNGSRFIVEERLNHSDNSVNYKIGIETKLSGVNYFYANEGQYRLFIQSEAQRLAIKGD